MNRISGADPYKLGDLVRGCRQGGGGGLGGLKPPQILSSCFYVYKQLLQKDVQNLLL